MTDTRALAREIEQAPAGKDSQRDLSHVYQELSQMKAQDPKFQQNLNELNQQLVKDKILPNFQIAGIDDKNHILTKNSADGSVTSQNASSVNDFGKQATGQSAASSYLPPGDQAMAKAFGIKVKANADGSYDVSSPLDRNPQDVAASIDKIVMNGLLGGGAGEGDSSQMPTLPGFNSLFQQAWQGWGEQPEAPPAPEDPPPPEPPSSGDA